VQAWCEVRSMQEDIVDGVKIDTEVEVLARRMWQRYVQAQPRDERGDYRPWEAQVDDATLRGFRSCARMVLATTIPRIAASIRRPRRKSVGTTKSSV